MRSRQFRLGLSVLGAVAILAATATAVAFGSTSKVSGNPITSAFAKTGKIPSAHLSFSLTISGAGAQIPGGTLTLQGTGGFDTKAKAAQFSLDLGSLASLVPAGSGQQIPKSIDLVVVKNVLYLHFPTLAAQLVPGKEWLKLDVNKVSKSLPKSVTNGVNPGSLTKYNPQAILGQLTASVRSKKVGSETVRGTPTTHYVLTVDLKKAVHVLPASQRASALKSLSQAGVRSVPIDVYLDGQRYVRRVAVSLQNLKTSSTQGPVSIAFSFDLFDFGTAVHVTAPPASQTADASALLSQLGSLGAKNP